MNGKPRVIRKVTQMGRDGRPKVVVDRRLRVRAERIVCHSDKRCCSPDCPHIGKLIAVNFQYVNITYSTHRVRHGSRSYPETKAFHMECVPDEMRPMLRFLIGSWPGPWASKV